MPSSPAGAGPATAGPLQFTPAQFTPNAPGPAVLAPVTPSYTGTAPAGTQLYYSSTAVQTVVAQDLGSTLTVGAITGFPQLYPFTLLLEWGTANQEVVTVTSAPTGNGPYTYTGVLRGCDGTAQVTHATGAQVNHGVSARDFTQSLITASAMAVSGTASSGQVLTATAANAATWQTGSGGGAVDWINVKSSPYNAAGNGSTDDTTAIQAALTAARTATYGGVVYLPAGIYIASQSLQVGSNTVLVGDGIGVTTIRCKASSLSSFTQVGANTGSPLLVNYGSTTASRIQVGPGITFDGNQANAGTLAGYADGPECSPVALWSTSLANVTGIEVINAIGYSVYLNGCTDSAVTGNRVLSGAGSALGSDQQDGIHLTNSSQCRVENNDVDTGTGAAGDDGIAVESYTGCSDIVVSGNVVRAAVKGVSLWCEGGALSNITITGNNVWTSSASAIGAAYGSGTVVAASNITIAGNTVSNVGTVSAAASGIYVALPFTGMSITGNTLSGFNNTAGGTGIYAVNAAGSGTCTDITISENTVTAMPGFYGILVGGSGTAQAVTNFSVTGNVCDLSTSTGGNEPVGVAVFASTYGSITGNTLTGNSDASSAAVYLSNSTTKVSVTGNNALNFNYGFQESGTGTQNNNSVGLNSFQGCTVPYSSVGVNDIILAPSGNGGIVGAEQFVCLTSAYTTAGGTTSLQKLFNATTTGALTLPVGTYFFECEFSLTAMSATSGTFSFGFGGTATIGVAWAATGYKGGIGYNWAASSAAAAIVSASTTTTGSAMIRGVIQVTITGTVIPSFATSVAAASVVGAGSYFRAWSVAASASAATVGAWS